MQIIRYLPGITQLPLSASSISVDKLVDVLYQSVDINNRVPGKHLG